MRSKPQILYLSSAIVLVVWVYMAFNNLTNQEAILELGGSFESLAYHATLFGSIQFLIMMSLVVLAKERFRDLGFIREDIWGQVWVGSLFGIGLLLFQNIILDQLLRLVLPSQRSEGINLANLFNNIYNYPLWILLAVFKGGFQEEMWRIFGLTRFEKCFGKPGLVIAIVLGSVVFGIQHLYQGSDTMASTMVLAVLFAMIYLRKRHAFEAVVAHAVFDIVGITVAYAMFL
jgi:hypothetical protein